MRLILSPPLQEREKRKEDTGDGDDRARARESHARFQERALLEISLGGGHPPNQRSELEGSGHDDHGCINNNDSVGRERRGQLLALFYDSVKSTGGVSAEPCDSVGKDYNCRAVHRAID